MHNIITLITWERCGLADPIEAAKSVDKKKNYGLVKLLYQLDNGSKWKSL